MLLRTIHRYLLRALLLIFAVSAGPAAGTAQTGDRPIDDNDILEAVEEDLRFDDAVPEHQIHVQVREGIVTLSGRSDTLLGQRQARQLVEALKGVRAVVNQVRVLPGGRSDDEILGEVEAALRDDPVADPDELQVKVAGGVVTLRGETDSYAERLLTERTVAGVRGVLDVENEIRIEAKQKRPDAEIRPEIERRLANNPWLAASRINVDVQDGRVTLNGTVGSLHEKSIARVAAWVAGVHAVDDSALNAGEWLDRNSRRESSTLVRNDVQIRRAVQDAFLYDPRLRGSNVAVQVRQGAVSLRGDVATLPARQAAEQDARHTMGVRRVINHLKVTPADWPGDDAVTKRVNEALARDAVLTRFDLRASCHFGKVYVRGEVNTSFEKNRAAVVVANVRGVLGVINRVSVDAVWEPKADDDIKEDVSRRMRWSPLLDRDQIVITVSDGVVTLMGTVRSYAERAAAERHARQGGARRVVNELQVRTDRSTPHGLKATLIPTRDVYKLKEGWSGEAFRRLLRTAERTRQYDRLPPPEVDLLFQLQNSGHRHHAGSPSAAATHDLRLRRKGGAESMMAISAHACCPRSLGRPTHTTATACQELRQYDASGSASRSPFDP